MDWDSFDQVVEYAKLEDEPILEDFETVVSDILESKELDRSYTSAQLPEGFEIETLEDADFGFESSKEYDDGRIEVEYRERENISFGATDSLMAEVHVLPVDYVFSEQWDSRH